MYFYRAQRGIPFFNSEGVKVRDEEPLLENYIVQQVFLLFQWTFVIFYYLTPPNLFMLLLLSVSRKKLPAFMFINTWKNNKPLVRLTCLVLLTRTIMIHMLHEMVSLAHEEKNELPARHHAEQVHTAVLSQQFPPAAITTNVTRTYIHTHTHVYTCRKYKYIYSKTSHSRLWQKWPKHATTATMKRKIPRKFPESSLSDAPRRTKPSYHTSYTCVLRGTSYMCATRLAVAAVHPGSTCYSSPGTYPCVQLTPRVTPPDIAVQKCMYSSRTQLPHGAVFPD